MPQLAELVNLESLDVSQNVLVQDKFLTVIGAQCKQLTSVDISCKYTPYFKLFYFVIINIMSKTKFTFVLLQPVIQLQMKV